MSILYFNIPWAKFPFFNGEYYENWSDQIIFTKIFGML